MRQLINLIEMPISSINLDGPEGNFNKGLSFDRIDKGILNSLKGRAKIARAFKKTPFDFEVYFISNNKIVGDDSETNSLAGSIGPVMKSGIHKDFDLDLSFLGVDQNLSIKGETGKIKVVLLSNLSILSEKMPMTSWTLAHKIGHAIFDTDFETHVYKKYIDPIAYLFSEISYDEEKYGNVTKDASGKTYFKFLTIKTARNGIRDIREYNVEIIAQYLIQGSVKMQNLLARDSTRNLKELNERITKLFQAIDGHVMVNL